MFKDKSLLITGGTGSFGNTVLNKFLDSELREIVIFSRDEKKQEDMRLAYNSTKLKFFIGDTRDPSSIKSAMVGVDYVFHAAALKQVPSCEFYPLEAVKTNILGTENVLAAALESNVKKVVVLSTDKAVYPINAMGISKAMAEKIVVAKSRLVPEQGPIFCATRYGNVMASRGSVIPLFIEQIKSGNPITITDEKMTRFLMSLDESVELVLHAFEYGSQGDLFVQKSPACTVGDLANALKILFKADTPIKVIGTRHGEKLYETLVSREEMARANEYKRYFRIKADNRDLNYNKFITDGQVSLNSAEDYTSHNTNRLNIDGIIAKLLSIEYVRKELLSAGISL